MSDPGGNIIPFTLDAQDGGEGAFDLAEAVRMAEALVFASAEPVSRKALEGRLPDGVDVARVMGELQRHYQRRGVNLVRVGDGWAFRTAGDLAWLMSRETVQQRKLSRAALEMLAIIAYHQPITRAEIEEIRGVETSKGTIDTLMETGWIRMAHPRSPCYLRNHGLIP
jgi:segregation and condensation protein B